MTKNQVDLLLKNGVSLEFVAMPAHLQLGFNLEIRKPGDLENTALKTARGEIRLFKSLDAIWSLVAMEWNRPFSVVPRNP